MPAMMASSTCAVQMLLVAFSRRMCCSRVCSARRRPAGRRASTETPTMRPGHRALVGVARGEEGGVRAAVAHRHAEALGAADGDVGAELARRRRAASAPAGRWPPIDQRAARRAAASISWREVADRAVDAGILQQHAEDLAGRRGRVGGSPTTTSMPSGSARVASTARVCGWQSASTKKASAWPWSTRVRHRHGLGGGGGLVEQRGVGELQAGQVDDHRLEVEQRLEPALADLGLVGRVGGVPARVLQHVALDHRRRDACRSSPCRSSR